VTKFLPGPGELPRVVRRTANRAQAEEWAYVLTALGILHEIRDEDGEHAVAVLPEDVAAAERALEAHEAERARPAARAEREYGPSLLWLAYAALLASFHFATGPRDESAAWFARKPDIAVARAEPKLIIAASDQAVPKSRAKETQRSTFSRSCTMLLAVVITLVFAE